MTVCQFENGYWYAVELKKFAKQIGIKNSSRLRKDELEKLIKSYLKTGKITPGIRKPQGQTEPKDAELGLSTKLLVIRFVNNKETWRFLELEAKKIDPKFRRKSGTKYRLNRWRDDQLVKGNPITYGDLVKSYVEINNSKEPRKRIEGTYYMYFLEDYMKNEPNAKRENGIKAWHELKEMNVPKTYRDWKAMKE